ncbi:glucose-1-phosphate thymidylyltransferase RfbA [Candidatus Omnitrophota bacterium]
MKGIILAGGHGTRLSPLTKAISKQLLPVYNKPMIYYPLSVLMSAHITEILVISTPQTVPLLQNLLGDGSHLGISLSYTIQEEPRGIAEAFIIGREFIHNDTVCLILGDNIFFGHGLDELLEKVAAKKDGATIFGYNVNEPERYGIVDYDKKGLVTRIEEKPKKPKANLAVTGLYFYDNDVVNIAASIKPSARGELEITDINNAYLKKKKLSLEILGRGYAWLDAGTYDSFIDAAVFIKAIEDRQGYKIGCIEETAYKMGYIDKQQLCLLAQDINNEYGDYLLKVAEE